MNQINADTPLEDLHVEFGTRPSAPAIDLDGRASNGAGRHLAEIHQMHLNDMGRIGIVMEKIELGIEDPHTLPEALQAMPMTDNMARFGTLCGRECRVLTGHHNAEQFMMFPGLRSVGNPELDAVVERLMAEHKVVHELLERLQQAANRLTFDPSKERFAETKAIFSRLHAVVKSHFGYEETQLEQALELIHPGM